MMEFHDPRPVKSGGKYDVVVVGGGVAGVAAAVAAAREGVSVLLIEKSVVLGGLATQGLISWYEPLCDGEGRQMICGLAQELIELAVCHSPNDLAQVWKEGGQATREDKRYACHFSPTIFSLQLDEFLVKNQVKVLLDTMITYPVMEGNVCRGLVAETKEGKCYFEAGVVIDATGDASVLHGCGVPTVDGENFLSYVSHYLDRAGAEKIAQTGDFVALRKWKCTASNMCGDGHPEGYPHYAGVTAEEITDFVMTGRRMLLEEIRQLPAGCFDLVSIPSVPQLRTSRRIDGAYTFTGEEENVRFEDSIGTCGDFRKRGKHYQLPYRVLYHEDYPNVLAAGRIVSAAQGDGWEIVRVIPVCVLTGQAAGVAAALSVLCNLPVKNVSTQELQGRLTAQKAKIDY